MFLARNNSRCRASAPGIERRARGLIGPPVPALHAPACECASFSRALWTLAVWLRLAAPSWRQHCVSPGMRYAICVLGIITVSCSAAPGTRLTDITATTTETTGPYEV